MSSTDLPNDISKEILIILNELVKKDPFAISQLFKYGVECSPKLLDSKYVIIREILEKDKTKYEISTLGIINSLLNKIGQQRIAAVLDENDNVLSFKLYRC